MKKTLKKYGKYLTSFAGLSVLMGMPLVAFGANDGWLANLNAFNTNAQLSGTGTSQDLVLWIGSLVSILIGFLGVLLVLYIIWAGFLWMTDGGEGKKVEKAKKMIQQAIIGIIIIFAAYAITAFVMDNLTNNVLKG
ncbi:MAG: hypothetical protein WCT26_00285 [Candidatus Buchananbacteria bacterium]